MKKPTKKQIVKMKVAEMDYNKQREAIHSKEPIYRGMRGGIGADPDDSVSKALEQMIGATIVNAGFVKTCKEGGLTIDFDFVHMREGFTEKKRIVIGYNDLGEWLEFVGERK